MILINYKLEIQCDFICFIFRVGSYKRKFVFLPRNLVKLILYCMSCFYL